MSNTFSGHHDVIICESNHSYKNRIKQRARLYNKTSDQNKDVLKVE